MIVGEDPTNVERVMRGIRNMGSFKPWGSAVSAIEIALWDIAGKSAGLPIYKLLGGKVRDKVRVYNGAVRQPMSCFSPQDYAENKAHLKVAMESVTLVKQSTSITTHTGEQIYLRQNFKDLIEQQAVRIIGPDPCDIGGLAELKWVAEYADLHGILIAPHGTGNGLIGLAALVQVSATLPQNYIVFEYPPGSPD